MALPYKIKILMTITLSVLICNPAGADLMPASASAQNNGQNTMPTALPLTDAQVQKLRVLFHEKQQKNVDPETQNNIAAVLPAAPAQIRALQHQNNAVNQAIQGPRIHSWQLANTVRTINLADNTAPPLLHVVQGYGTNISFVGANGKAWPIEAAVPGDSDFINVDQSTPKNPLNSTVLVNKAGATTNITYYLKGRVKPVVLFFRTSNDPATGLDASVSIIVNGNPPGTAPLTVRNVGGVSDAVLNALDSAPGSRWQAVPLANQHLPVDIRYWISPGHRHVIVRLTSGVLVSPNWLSQASNVDGTVTAYEFNYVPLMFLVDSNDGQSFQVRVREATQTLAGRNTSNLEEGENA